MNILISVILLALLTLVFLKERTTAHFYLPGVVRIVMLLLLLLMLFEVRFTFSLARRAKIPILVLVDNSQSFVSEDNSQIVASVLKKLRSFRTGSRFYLFSDTILPFKDYTQAGSRTDIAQALSYALTKKPGAVVVVSDGLHNYGGDPITIAQNFTCPVYTIGIGREFSKDMYIDEIQYPVRTFLSDTLEIICRIGNYQIANYITNVTLKEKSETIQKQSLAITTPNTLQEVIFKILPKTTGRHSLVVELDSAPGEENYKNNRREFSFEVLQNRYTVVYITNAPSFNTRFILDALRNNPEAEFSVYPYIAFVGRNYEGATAEPLAQVAPVCDVLILDDINENELTSEIKTFLNEHLKAKKGFLILAQENFNPRDFLNAILPADYSKVNIIKRDLIHTITSEARGTPIFYNSTGEYLLERAAPFLGARVPTALKPNASVWLYNPDNNIPLMLSSRYQGSKVILITGFPIFRLGFGGLNPEVQRLRFREFLGNLTRFLALPDFKNFQVITDKRDYLVGEKIRLTLYATTPDGRFWSGLNAWAEVTQFQKQVPFYESRSGIYLAELNAESPGEVLVKIKIASDSANIGELEVPIVINPQSVEDIRGLNASLLKRIAELTGGKYYTAEEFLNSPDEITPIAYKTKINIYFSNNPYIYALLAGLLGLMIYLRKKIGLL